MSRTDSQPSAAQVAALQAFAAEHGRHWKNDLIEDWMTGADHSPALRQLRNEFGPTWLLTKFKLPKPSPNTAQRI